MLGYSRSRKDGVAGSKSIDYSSNCSSVGFKLKSYHNVTGPGDYNVPSYTGKQSHVAGRRNGPSFSFGHRPTKIQFFSKEYLRVILCF